MKFRAIARPWRMNFWTPMTSKMGDGWTYKHAENKIRGIKQTHQPSPWLNDYGAFSFMAVTGNLKFDQGNRAAWFSHKIEKAGPDYYSVYLADHDVTAEVTPTTRAARFRFTFPEREHSYIILDAFDGGSMVRILPEQRKIIGYARNNRGGVPDNFRNYFVAEFDKDFAVTHTWHDDWQLRENTLESEGTHVGAIVGFKTGRGEQIDVKVASSFISPQQAQRNLDREIGDDSFERVRRKTRQTWQRKLERIRVESTDLDRVLNFYSALYRMLLFPRKFYEFDADNEVVHNSPYNEEVLPGYLFTDIGFGTLSARFFPFSP